ncbi:MAG: chromosome segregation protein SMC, partial [Armatimonadota bacterium]|nr:chromosome segregation protein SMC [Armatimonadota bacterium]
MYLKRLELQGFKTFAIPTELEFPPGITAIVGPNGSGKSNLFDAIRWVLGETSVRTLRGTRMEDVIFAGSERRRALGLATVSLTLDNTSGLLPVDFSEVTVTRRATRGGEGEYFLNGVPCRLRDIQNLFLGTGLGGRSYALIGQGEVDAILDASPEERRFLLEEAAGLARYKRRKVEAERRLASVGQNLLRLDDLVRELHSQLSSLAQQAEVAERYQSYVQELRDVELSLLIDDLLRTSRSLRRLGSQIKEVQRKLEETRRDRDNASTRLAGARAQAEAVTRALEEAQRELVRTLEEQGRVESEYRLLEEKIRVNRAQEAQMLQELNGVEEALVQCEEELRSLGTRSQEYVQQKASLEASIAEEERVMAELARKGSEAEERLEALRTDAVELARARSQAQNELASFQAKVSRIQAQVEGAQEQERKLLEELKELEHRRLTLWNEVETAQMVLSHAEESLNQVRARASTTQEELEALRKQEQALSLERQALLSRLQYLEEAQAQYTGYDTGTREVLLAQRKEPGMFPQVLGALGDLICVPPHLRKAFEAALHTRLSTLITGTWEEARTVLEWLKERGAGVSILPLDLLPPLPQPPGVIVGPGIIGRAVDFLSADGRVEDVLRVLLRNVLIVEDLETALRIHREGYPGGIVTLEGEAVSAEGVVQFLGFVNHEARILGRREEVEGTRKALSMVEGRLGEVERRRRDLTMELARLEATGKEGEATVQASRQTLLERQKELALLEEQLARLPRGIEEARGTRETLSEEMEEAMRRIQGLEREILELDKELEETERAAQQLQSEARALEERRRSVQERLLSLRVSLAEVHGGLEGITTRLQEREEERERLRSRSGALQQAVEALRVERASLEKALEETRGRLRGLEEILGQ